MKELYIIPQRRLNIQNSNLTSPIVSKLPTYFKLSNTSLSTKFPTRDNTISLPRKLTTTKLPLTSNQDA